MLLVIFHRQRSTLALIRSGVERQHFFMSIYWQRKQRRLQSNIFTNMTVCYRMTFSLSFLFYDGPPTHRSKAFTGTASPHKSMLAGVPLCTRSAASPRT